MERGGGKNEQVKMNEGRLLGLVCTSQHPLAQEPATSALHPQTPCLSGVRPCHHQVLLMSFDSLAHNKAPRAAHEGHSWLAHSLQTRFGTLALLLCMHALR